MRAIFLFVSIVLAVACAQVDDSYRVDSDTDTDVDTDTFRDGGEGGDTWAS